MFQSSIMYQVDKVKCRSNRMKKKIIFIEEIDGLTVLHSVISMRSDTYSIIKKNCAIGCEYKFHLK